MNSQVLKVGECAISAPSDELLFRQITPNIWVEADGVPASHAFGPKPADCGMPSYSRQSLVANAKDCFDWHNDNATSPSLGVWACTVTEVSAAQLVAIDDGGTVPPPTAPGHCFVDFRDLSKREERNRRAILFRYALARGQLHP